MKKDLKSRDSNLNGSALSTLAATIMLCVALAPTTQIFAQRRLGRPPSGRDLEGTPILAAGTSVIPDGTVLMVEMDTGIDSGSAQISDRFQARIATPVVDAGGRTLLPAGAVIEGHVTNVKKAKWGHRSGELGLSFDYIEWGDGRRLPLRGTLVNANKRIDEEGDLRAKSAVKRDVLVTTGGAVAGAGVGMVTGGSILVGGGVGAAAGLTLVMLIKGKDVVVDPGDRFNLQLVQPLSLTSSNYYAPRPPNGTGSYGPIREPIPLQPRSRTSTRTRTPTGYNSGFGQYNDPNAIRTSWSRVPIYDVRAERDRDGMVRIIVTAETPTSGWRIYTNHEVQPRDTVDIRLMGVPPSGSGARQISHPSAAPICVEDRGAAIRRIVVRGSNGDRYLTIGSGIGSAQLDPYSRPSSSGQQYPSNPSTYPSNQQPYTPQPASPQPVRPRPGVGPSDGSMGNLPFPSTTTSPGAVTGSTAQLSSLATQVANQVEVLKFNYAAAIGLYRNRNGTFESLGGRNPTANERELVDTLNYLQTSAKGLAAPSIDTYNRQRAGQQLQNDAQTAQNMWQRAKSTGMISQDLDRQWQNLQPNLRALISAATR
jgi:hypothetical protein